MENKLKSLSAILLILGVIVEIATFQPLVLPKVVSGTMFNTTFYDNQFSFIGLICWLGCAVSIYTLYLILRSLAEILHRLPEKKEPKVEAQETSEEEIIEILRKENHWDDDAEVDDK